MAVRVQSECDAPLGTRSEIPDLPCCEVSGVGRPYAESLGMLRVRCQDADLGPELYEIGPPTTPEAVVRGIDVRLKTLTEVVVQDGIPPFESRFGQH